MGGGGGVFSASLQLHCNGTMEGGREESSGEQRGGEGRGERKPPRNGNSRAGPWLRANTVIIKEKKRRKWRGAESLNSASFSSREIRHTQVSAV